MIQWADGEDWNDTEHYAIQEEMNEMTQDLFARIEEHYQQQNRNERVQHIVVERHSKWEEGSMAN